MEPLLPWAVLPHPTPAEPNPPSPFTPTLPCGGSHQWGASPGQRDSVWGWWRGVQDCAAEGRLEQESRSRV